MVQKKVEGVESPYSTKQGKQGPIQSKQSKKPPIQAKQRPIQRNNKPSSGSGGKSGQIASAMGQQYGVDTSGLQINHNSSFPNQVNAEATIQGNKIDFAPGKDSEKNIKHEVGHYIINTKRGTPPKADAQVNGQAVNTSDEAAADKMMNAPLQMKASNEASLLQTNTQPSSLPSSSVVQNKGNEVIQAKLKVDGKFYGEESEGIYDAYSYTKDQYQNQVKLMLKEEGTYVFGSWAEFKSYMDGNIHDKGVIGDRTVTLDPKLYIIGEVHTNSPKGTLEWGIKPSNLIYEGNMVEGQGGDGKNKLDHGLLQAMFILTVTADTYKKGKALDDYAYDVLSSHSTSSPGVKSVVDAINDKLDADEVISKAVVAYNTLNGQMKGDARGRVDKLNGDKKMWDKMQTQSMYTASNVDSDSDFDATGKQVMDARDYFFANQIEANRSRPMIALMGDAHVEGTVNYLDQAGIKDVDVYRNLPKSAEAFANKNGKKVEGNGSDNNIYEDLPESMKDKKVSFFDETPPLKPKTPKKADFSGFSLAPPPSKKKATDSLFDDSDFADFSGFDDDFLFDDASSSPKKEVEKEKSKIVESQKKKKGSDSSSDWHPFD